MRYVTDEDPARRPTAPLTRADDGRWLGGVCAGLARQRGLPVGGLRAAFVGASLLGGLGVLVYLACWLIIPAAGETASARGPRGVVVLAQVGATLVGLGTLAVAAALATVFGPGWTVLVVAGAVLVGVLAAWPRVAPAWALLPVAAMALPALGVAAADVRLPAQFNDVVAVPRDVAELPAGGFRTGVGSLLVDLRHTKLPASGTVPLRIDAGLRRTVVALPHDRCVHVVVRYRARSFTEAVSHLLGDESSAMVTVYGRVAPGSSGTVTDVGKRAGPTVAIDLRTSGADLDVRDYPDQVAPVDEPGWPYALPPVSRPITDGLSRRDAREVLRAWRAERPQRRRDARLQAGPCAGRGRRS